MGNTQGEKSREKSNNRFQLKSLFYSKPVAKLLMVSLDGAGKTTMLYNLAIGQIVSIVPTVGFNVQTVQFEKNNLQFWDVGGGWMIRLLWKHYLHNTRGIIYVIDLSDEGRLGEALHWLEHLLSQQESKGKYLFIIGTKKDLARPTMLSELEKKIIQMNIMARYRIKYVSCFDKKELQSTFEEISEILSIVD